MAEQPAMDPRYHRRRPRSGDSSSLPDRPKLQSIQGGGQGKGQPAGNLSALPGGKGANDHVQSDRAADRPNLRAMEGGGQTTAPRTGHLSDVSADRGQGQGQPGGQTGSAPLSSGELGERENLQPSGQSKYDDPDMTGGMGRVYTHPNETEGSGKSQASGDDDNKKGAAAEDKNAADAKDSDADKQQAAEAEDNEAESSAKTNRFRGWLKKHKKQAAVGGILGVLLGGGGFAVYLSAPILEGGVILQEAKTFERFDAKGEHDSSGSVKRLFRWARAINKQNYGETRVGKVGSVVYGSAIDDLARSGVTFELNVNGSLGKVHLDTDKLKEKFPELDGMNSTEQKDFYREKFNLTGDAGINLFDDPAGPGKYVIDARYLDYATTKALGRSTLSLAEDGKTPNWIKWRFARAIWNLPSAFHPWKQVEAKVTNNIADNLSLTQEEKDAEAKRLKAIDDSVAARGDPAVTDARDKATGVRGTLTKALTVTGAACVAYSIADDIIQINHQRIVEPSEARANDVKSGASQMMYGSGTFNSSQPGAMYANQLDKYGHGIATSAAYLAISNDGTQRGGYNMPKEDKQAFEGNTTVANIRGGINSVLGGTADALCSPTGLIAQGVLMLGLSFIGDPATALTPKLVGSWLLKESTSAIVAAVAMHFATEFILNKTTDAKLAETAFKGPLGGELMTYGARAAANQVGIAGGAVSLGNNTSTKYAAQYAAAEKEDFEHQNFFARVFDPSSQYSLAGHMAMAMNPTLSGNIASMSSGILNLGNTLGNVFSSLMPKVGASAPYDWGFPQYGIPDVVLNDAALQNPYANGERVAELLDGNVSGPHGNYKDMAMTCFGDNITNDNPDHLWDVLPTNDVNTGSQEYTDAGCNDLSDENWRRMIMFVEDTNTMNAVACFQGDQDSCNRVQGEPVSGSTPASTGSSAAGDYYAASDTMTCSAGSDGGVQDGYYNGTLVKIRICDVPTPAGGNVQVNARIAANVAKLYQAAAAAGVTMGGGGFRTNDAQIAARKANNCPDISTSPASSCNPPTAIPGYSDHQMGLAIDFTQNGSVISRGSPGFNWLTANAATYGLKNLPTEAWHWSVDGN